MTPEEKLRQLVQEGDVLRRKAIDTPDKFTEPDTDTEIAREHATISAMLSRQKNIADQLVKAGAGS